MSATGHRARSRPPGAPHPDDHVIVLFGATGDLARRKLLPGLFHLAAAGLLPTHYRIVGTAPAEFAICDAAFREHAHDAVAEFGITKPSGDVWEEFEPPSASAPPIPATPPRWRRPWPGPRRRSAARPRRLYHLAIPPDACRSVVALLGATGLADGSRVIAEKPFGTDLASARALNDAFHAVFDESQIFRIDHFLGKESVDNILALRFANGLFEPSWNRDHIAYVQIDVPETLSIEGRAAFYEDTGAFRDMIVTHLFQVLGIVAMEPPTNLSAKALRDEKAKVFDAMAPVDVAHVVRGQYDGYRDEPGVDPASQTETFVALRVEVDNWRWNGVPFCSGRGRTSGPAARSSCSGSASPRCGCSRSTRSSPPRAGATSSSSTSATRGRSRPASWPRSPGRTCASAVPAWSSRYADSFTAANDLEGYERLILDAMLGDQSLFTRSDGIERLWEVSAPLLEAPPPVEPYAPGSWGPATIDQLTAPHRWYLRGGA